MKKIFVVVTVLAVISFIYYFRSIQNVTKTEVPPPTPAEKETPKTPDYSGIQVPEVVATDLAEGEGNAVIKGDKVKIHYTMWVYDPAAPANRGPLISSTEGHEPDLTTIGEKKLISGWESGMIGMKPQGKRRLIVPAGEAYGEDGVPGSIPPNSILMIEVSLVEVVK